MRARWRLGHGPHMHGDRPAWLYHSFPHLWKYNLTIRAEEIIVSFVYVWSNYIDIEESLLDQFFHSLDFKLVPWSTDGRHTESYLPCLA